MLLALIFQLLEQVWWAKNSGTCKSFYSNAFNSNYKKEKEVVLLRKWKICWWRGWSESKAHSELSSVSHKPYLRKKPRSLCEHLKATEFGDNAPSLQASCGSCMLFCSRACLHNQSERWAASVDKKAAAYFMIFDKTMEEDDNTDFFFLWKECLALKMLRTA
jgi:hypothetical protein